MVCVWRSRLRRNSSIRWKNQLLAVKNRRSFPTGKKTSYIPRHRPPTPIKFGSEDSQSNGAYILGRFIVIRALVRRGFVAAVGAVCEKHVFFLRAAYRNAPSLPTALPLIAGIRTIKGNLFSFLFSYPIIVGLGLILMTRSDSELQLLYFSI